MMTLWYIILTVLVCVSAIMAILSKDLLRSAIGLGVGSVALAAILFLLGAGYAGAFELSVGAGLISVLFIVVISLTESIGGSQ